MSTIDKVEDLSKQLREVTTTLINMLGVVNTVMDNQNNLNKRIEALEIKQEPKH